MSFFLKKGSKMNGRKRKAPSLTSSNSKMKKKSIKQVDDDDEEILSDDSEVEGRPLPPGDGGYGSDPEEEEEEEEEDVETSDEKRIRLARLYLEEIEREEKARADDDDDTNVDRLIDARLESDRLREKGKLRECVAGSLLPVRPEDIIARRDKTHKLAITAVVASPDGRHFYSASKDGGLVKRKTAACEKVFKVEGGRKGTEDKHRGHCSSINALAVSSDGKFLASGDCSKLIRIWNAETMELVHTFKGHRDAISGLAFRINAPALYSCSYDRSVKVWNMDQLSYVETLFGHQDKITGIDAGRRERAVTSGGRDGSVRVWKIVEESQLVFNGPECSTDIVKLINEEHFVTGGEDGHISLWGVMKKKPLVTVRNAHGVDATNGEPMWIASIAVLSQTDLVASGSRDGFIRLWKCGSGFRKLEEIQKVPLVGFVNSLSFCPDGRTLIAGVGQEHRLGRWWRIPEARNSVVVIPLSYRD